MFEVLWSVADARRYVRSLPRRDDVVRRYIADALIAEIERLEGEMESACAQRDHLQMELNRISDNGRGEQ